MSKYLDLKLHLQNLNGNEWVASFADIENVLGFPLPASAYNYPAWWSNQAGGGHSQSASWQEAEWKTEDINLTGKTVTFSRQKPSSSRRVVKSTLTPEASENASSFQLTIAQAKLGLANTFGVPEESIEITIKG